MWNLILCKFQTAQQIFLYYPFLAENCNILVHLKSNLQRELLRAQERNFRSEKFDLNDKLARESLYRKCGLNDNLLPNHFLFRPTRKFKQVEQKYRHIWSKSTGTMNILCQSKANHHTWAALGVFIGLQSPADKCYLVSDFWTSNTTRIHYNTLAKAQGCWNQLDR